MQFACAYIQQYMYMYKWVRHLLLSIPLGVELIEKVQHVLVSFLCSLPACFCLHQTFQPEELFVKVIDGRCIGFLVLFLRDVFNGRIFGVV